MLKKALMMPDFRTQLATLGLRQVELRRWIETLTGRQIHKSTTSKLAGGQHQPSPEMEALLITAENHPAVLAEIKGSRKTNAPNAPT